MGLLDVLAPRIGQDQAKRNAQSAQAAPIRPPMQWGGFGAQQQQMLEELMRRIQMQQTQGQSMAGRMAAIPGLINKGG